MNARASRVFVLAAFLVSRILYFIAGIRFDSTPIVKYWQYIDPVLMRNKLLESLWYLHMQPPGFNLAVGFIVKLFPSAYGLVLNVLYLIIGVLIAFSLLHLMERFRVSRPIATALTALFIASPGCVLYENFAVYEYPVLLLLLLAAIALFRFCEAPGIRRSAEFFACILALTMVRNQFHIVYVILIAAALAIALPAARRFILIGAVPVIALVLGVYLKNWILFGAFTSSSWAGMATGVTTTFQLSSQEADNLIQRGIVTPLARITPFSDLPAYSAFVQIPPKTGIDVLDEQETMGGGHPNFNNPAYLKIHEMYLANSKAIWRHYPIAYVRSMMIAWFAYFLPASDLHSFDIERRKIGTFDRVFNVLCFGQFRQADSRKDLRAIRASGNTLTLILYTGMFLLVLLPILVLWALALLLRPRLRRALTTPQVATLAFIVFTILFTTAVSNLLSSFENNRYRFPLDGYYLLLLAMAVTTAVQRFGKVRRQVKAESTASP
jgi:hypothetical protein